MKRLASIALLALLLYHTLGQALVFWGEEWIEGRQMASSLNIYHSTDDLIEFELPVPLHQYGMEIQESSGGEFEYKGAFYNIVRQELRNDTLHILCYEDLNERVRHAGLSDFLHKNLGTSSDNEKSGNWVKNWISDYDHASRRHLIFVYEDSPAPTRPAQTFCLTSPLLTTHSPPPELRA
ncbi:MAG: hypothetical protein LH606_13690 [Cytophagaceae bacterium]|nr:hypothetical protein [Cytophagaceae bacterium]